MRYFVEQYTDQGFKTIEYKTRERMLEAARRSWSNWLVYDIDPTRYGIDGMFLVERRGTRRYDLPEPEPTPKRAVSRKRNHFDLRDHKKGRVRK